jgi:O-acetyl-ADP-ribose deacetylase (regulator of RNase III)
MGTSHPPHVEIVEGDLTRIAADAIVNAANAELAMGGGVCGAIFRAAGVEELTRACKAIGHCHTGSAVLTPAFGIKTARCIIHAVGPVYSRYAPDEARTLLRSAYASAIRLAAAHGCASIAFPAISTGIYGYPLDEAAREAADICLAEADATGLRVMLVGFDAAAVAALKAGLDHALASRAPLT